MELVPLTKCPPVVVQRYDTPPPMLEPEPDSSTDVCEQVSGAGGSILATGLSTIRFRFTTLSQPDTTEGILI
jgi:hypothetical protein